MQHLIRLVRSADAPALHAIYTNYVHTDVSFDYSLPSLDIFQKMIEDIQVDFPFLVAQQDAKATGYAYAHRIREREAYQWSAELSVYLDPAATSGGLGSRLYLSLIEILKLQGVRTVYGAITSGNDISLRFHEKLGFQFLTTFENVGYKNGHWLHVHWVQKQISPYSTPAPVIRFCALDKSLVRSILTEANQQEA